MNKYSTKIIIFSGVYALLIGALVYFIIIPNMSKLDQSHIEIAKMESKYKENQDKIAALEKTNASIDQFDLISQTVAGLLPDAPNISSFIVQTEGLSNSLNLKMSTFSIDEVAATSKKKTTESDSGDSGSTKAQTEGTTKSSSTKSDQGVRFTINSSGDFSSLFNFIKSMENLARYNSVTSIEATTKDEILNFKLTGNIYNGK